MKILLLNGVNLNMLGSRDSRYYGTDTLAQLEEKLCSYAAQLGVELVCNQSNIEGELVNILQQTDCDAVVFNAGAYSHYSYALRDCIECLTMPVVEVHMSNIYAREPFRHNDVLADVCVARFYGKGIDSYVEAIDYLIKQGNRNKVLQVKYGSEGVRGRRLTKVRSPHTNTRVVLIGFAASYKSSVGRLLADKLGCGFVDTDAEIERKCNKSIRQIFATYGEQHFREMEKELLGALTHCNAVVACGGGIVLADNFDDFAKDSVVIWLTAEASTVHSRLDGVSRPLFDGLTVAELRDYIDKRSQLYAKYARVTFPTDGKTPPEVAEEVYRYITEKTKKTS